MCVAQRQGNTPIMSAHGTSVGITLRITGARIVLDCQMDRIFLNRRTDRDLRHSKRREVRFVASDVSPQRDSALPVFRPVVMLRFSVMTSLLLSPRFVHIRIRLGNGLSVGTSYE